MYLSEKLRNAGVEIQEGLVRLSSRSDTYTITIPKSYVNCLRKESKNSLTAGDVVLDLLSKIHEMTQTEWYTYCKTNETAEAFVNDLVYGYHFPMKSKTQTQSEGTM